jgi:hypothetical protein
MYAARTVRLRRPRGPLRAESAIGRLNTVDEVAALAVLLASEVVATSTAR